MVLARTQLLGSSAQHQSATQSIHELICLSEVLQPQWWLKYWWYIGLHFRSNILNQIINIFIQCVTWGRHIQGSIWKHESEKNLLSENMNLRRPNESTSFGCVQVAKHATLCSKYYSPGLLIICSEHYFLIKFLDFLFLKMKSYKTQFLLP